MASSSRVKGEELGKLDRRRLIPSANDPIHTTKDVMIPVDKHFPITRAVDNEESRNRYGDARSANVEEDGSKIVDVIYGDEDACRTTVEVANGKQDPRGTDGKEDARGQSASEVSDDVTKYEARLEAMMLSDPGKSFCLHGGTCIWHTAPILQIFSVKMAKIPVASGSAELHGYIAARDLLDPLLNYVVNISRDDPITVEQGSFIEMIGSKRGIKLSRTVLIECDMRIKTGEREKDNLQLIDGVSIVDELMTSCKP